MKRLGKQTVKFTAPPSFAACAAVVGRKEGEGPLKACFDRISDDPYFGESSWEKAESTMIRQCFDIVCDKAKLSPSELGMMFSGDLLNQCVSSVFALKDSYVPYFGVYGACSTMAESLILAAMAVDGGFSDNACAITGSHFCSAERQYRFPLEYGGQRPPTAQWTVTGAGAAIITAVGTGPFITHASVGLIKDAGINDANNMGAAMAPAAYETIKAHLYETGRNTEYYDAIFTGDLGAIGHDIFEAFFLADGIKLGPRYMDCGVLMYDRETQGVNAGGSGCGCSAAVLCGHIINAMKKGIWNRVLFAPTGALMSPTSAQQGSSIPGICHAIAIENTI